MQAPGRVRGRIGPQRHEHHERHPPDPGPARPPARGRRPTPPTPRASANRSGSSTCTTSSSSAATCRSPTPARAPGSTPARSAPTTPIRERVSDVARVAVRRRRRAGDQGPARRVVPGAVARGGRALRRDLVLRHHAATGHRGRRVQEEVLRPAPGRRHPHRRVDQHDAPHRARDPRREPAGSCGTPTCWPTGRSRCSRWARPSTCNAVKTAMANDIAQVHKFIDPSLRRVTLTWDDVDVPASLRDLAEETWQTLDGLADEGGTPPRPTSAATSSASPTTRCTPTPRRSPTRRRSPRVARARPPPAARSRRASGPVRPGGGADRVPHAVRAHGAEGARRSLRKALGRER